MPAMKTKARAIGKRVVKAVARKSDGFVPDWETQRGHPMEWYDQQRKLAAKHA